MTCSNSIKGRICSIEVYRSHMYIIQIRFHRSWQDTLPHPIPIFTLAHTQLSHVYNLSSHLSLNSVKSHPLQVGLFAVSSAQQQSYSSPLPHFGTTSSSHARQSARERSEVGDAATAATLMATATTIVERCMMVVSCGAV